MAEQGIDAAAWAGPGVDCCDRGGGAEARLAAAWQVGVGPDGRVPPIGDAAAPADAAPPPLAAPEDGPPVLWVASSLKGGSAEFGRQIEPTDAAIRKGKYGFDRGSFGERFPIEYVAGETVEYWRNDKMAAAGGLEDLRTCWIDADERGARFKERRKVVQESTQEVFTDSRVQTLIYVLYFVGTCDHLNMGAMASLEVVARCLLQHAEAYARGAEQANWEAAKHLATTSKQLDPVPGALQSCALALGLAALPDLRRAGLTSGRRRRWLRDGDAACESMNYSQNGDRRAGQAPQGSVGQPEMAAVRADVQQRVFSASRRWIDFDCAVAEQGALADRTEAQAGHAPLGIAGAAREFVFLHALSGEGLDRVEAAAPLEEGPPEICAPLEDEQASPMSSKPPSRASPGRRRAGGRPVASRPAAVAVAGPAAERQGAALRPGGPDRGPGHFMRADNAGAPGPSTSGARRPSPRPGVDLHREGGRALGGHADGRGLVAPPTGRRFAAVRRGLRRLLRQRRVTGWQFEMALGHAARMALARWEAPSILRAVCAFARAFESAGFSLDCEAGRAVRGNKSHMAGAAAAGAGSLLGNFAGEKAQGGDMGLDEYTAAGPSSRSGGTSRTRSGPCDPAGRREARPGSQVSGSSWAAAARARGSRARRSCPERRGGLRAEPSVGSFSSSPFSSPPPLFSLSILEIPDILS
ncbi:unnamed protein product [Prorocentrum cordatum]|uniref:Uncharacterized protein n=1 Tax=Prorocentrum cordatum TaxID=2364126 RepID=A0ABN9VHC8_9DINO|nr:unnamed protein product [Polarella glacialis]